LVQKDNAFHKINYHNVKVILHKKHVNLDNKVNVVGLEMDVITMKIVHKYQQKFVIHFPHMKQILQKEHIVM
jgi:hypothetical protein